MVQTESDDISVAESDTSSDLGVSYIECKVGCVVRLGTACTD